MTAGYIYCFVHENAPDRVKVGFSGRDPNVCQAKNRECRAAKLNSGLQVFGFAPLQNGFEPLQHEHAKEIDKVLRRLLKPFALPAEERGKLTEVYRLQPSEVLKYLEQARMKVEEEK
ncbi:hypothetical protein [Sphingomonas panni]|uniref:hypothetical protein n=1 Tax=Sphingomonas panni TaxID=237612 RepID=UPI001F5BED63|nr:hypothetical protein [Sphingomonas panni]